MRAGERGIDVRVTKRWVSEHIESVALRMGKGRGIVKPC